MKLSSGFLAGVTVALISINCTAQADSLLFTMTYKGQAYNYTVPNFEVKKNPSTIVFTTDTSKLKSWHRQFGSKIQQEFATSADKSQIPTSFTDNHDFSHVKHNGTSYKNCTAAIDPSEFTITCPR